MVTAVQRTEGRGENFDRIEVPWIVGNAPEALRRQYRDGRDVVKRT